MRLIVLMLLTSLFCFSCSPEKKQDNIEARLQQAIEAEKPFSKASLVLTTEELAYLDNLRKQGGLHVAIEHTRTVYVEQEDGTIQGMHYKLLKAFAAQLKLPLHVNKTKWEDFFTYKGKTPQGLMENADLAYTPDIFSQNQLLVTSFSDLPWRRKLMSFVEVYPSRMLLVTRKGEEFSELKQLDGKKVVTTGLTSWHKRLLEISRQENISMEFIFNEDGEIDSSFKILQQGKADLTVQDAHNTISSLPKHPGLNVSIPINDMEFLCWAVKKDDKVLASILGKYMHYVKQQGLFSALWQEQYGITLTQYYRLINYTP